MPGSKKTTEESFIDLHEHSLGLARLAKWDRAAPLLGAGALILGAGLGAWVAGEHFISISVLTCLSVGCALLVGGGLLRDERIESARVLYESFERRLVLYDDDPDIQNIKARMQKVEELADEKKLISRIGRRMGSILHGT